ncbi:PhzF family phenazine biosynthesis protein [Candidatus Viadribacter manganicus]|uniref:Phenazine biosynthesis protein PhzF n=1 Tax=Candidatus Viadribacter manganicus TaxID=1759059 RepID=A0A1B1AJ61_9PROT|nr:PhzF family phenazine biosynthesis protein [Candidatus Viadribacter manganicus]ANP46593.1 phenazine biosynthesis protein PhzF [Candidatus Viadribacter manganicus]
MPIFAFETVDVFTDQRFGGNPLAVFKDARGLSAGQMQQLAFEFNLSETTFVLPPENTANTARVRIFNRTTEMAFAGHPSIGAAYVMARAGLAEGDHLRLEAPAGIVAVELERGQAGEVIGGKITAPQPLSTGPEIGADTIAACLGLVLDDVVTSTHAPIVASMGNPYVFAELRHDAIARCAPDLTAFRLALASRNDLGARFSIFVYVRDGDQIRARMFAPISGTWEDPATGSANAPLAGLLLQHSTANDVAFTVRQGEEMGRPSLLRITASRRGGEITATVAGHCVPVFRGEAVL